MKKFVLLGAFWLAALGLKADEIYATFEAEAVQFAHLSLQAQGVIVRVEADVGSRVQKNDLLLRLQSREEAELLKAAQVDLTQAKNRFDRFSALKETISLEEYEGYEAAYLRAEANFKYRQAVLENRELRAPFSGVVAARYVHPGDLIERAGQGALMLVDDSQTKLIISFDQRYLGQVKEGMIYTFTIDGGAKRSATIKTLYPTVDPATRKARAAAYVTGVTHGLFGEGRISLVR